MEVFVALSHVDYEGYSIMGVSSSADSALEFIKNSDNEYADWFSIRTYTLNGELVEEHNYHADKTYSGLNL